MDLTFKMKTALIMGSEKGSKLVPVLDEKVPEDCEGGFGTWHPTKRECLTCPYVPICFCKATNTQPVEAEISMKKVVRKDEGRLDPIMYNKTINPFRKNGYNWVSRNLLVEMARRGKTEFNQRDLFLLAGELQFKVKSENPEYWWDPSFKSLDKAQYDKAPKTNYRLFFDTVSCTGGKELDRSFVLRLDKILLIIQKAGGT